MHALAAAGTADKYSRKAIKKSPSTFAPTVCQKAEL
jgi:hypothetical protein